MSDLSGSNGGYYPSLAPSGFLNPQKRKEHIMRKIVRENPNLVLIIVGHTFYQGTK